MVKDIVHELHQIQQYAAGLRRLLESAQAQVPTHSESTDRSSMIRVSLDADGLPASIRIEPGWQRRLSAEAFGTAVVEAGQAAMGARLEAWARGLQESGWIAEVDQFQEEVAAQYPVAPAARPPAFTLDGAAKKARPVDAVAEEVIRALDEVTSLVPAPPQASVGHGVDESGALTLTISRAGLVSCHADPRWVGKQSTASLSNALSEALAAARADLTRHPAHPAPSSGWDRLFVEALELLNEPHRVSES